MVISPEAGVNLQALSTSLANTSTNQSPSALTKGNVCGIWVLILGIFSWLERVRNRLRDRSIHSWMINDSGCHSTRPLSKLERVKKSCTSFRIRSESQRAVLNITCCNSQGISGSVAKLSKQT